MTFTSMFKKRSDKVAGDTTTPKPAPTDDKETEQTKEDEGKVTLNPKEEGVVYAELDLQNAPQARALLVRPDNDKTEYAEIIHKDTK